jgi:hypothetical protein
MEKLLNQYSGQGTLIFDGNGSASVTYRIDEFQDFISDGLGGEIPGMKDTRGRVNHVQVHPNWHPLVSVGPGPFTLVLEDGRKLKVIFASLDGSIQGTGDFF